MRRLMVTSLLLGLAAAALPAAAHAGCGDVQRVMPKKRKLGPNRPPLIVGDSVLLGAMPEVAREGIEVNARGCRQWSEGVSYLYRRRHARTLPKVVIMQLGTNASITVGAIRKALDITGRRRLLVVMTPREVGGFGGPDARAVRKAAKLFPGRMLALDWARYTRRRPGWFAPDGIHLTYAGAAGIARYLRRQAKFFVPPQPKQDRAASA